MDPRACWFSLVFLVSGFPPVPGPSHFSLPMTKEIQPPISVGEKIHLSSLLIKTESLA